MQIVAFFCLFVNGKITNHKAAICFFCVVYTRVHGHVSLLQHMTSRLDTSRTYHQAGLKRVLGSLRMFGDQCRAGFRGGRSVAFPSSYRSVNQVVVVGMGGSTLGSDVLRSVFSNRLRVPFIVVNSYTLPASVGPKTLVFLSSYSGGTEEVLAAASDARRLRAKITGLTQGGKLGAFFRRHGYPWYAIDGKYNPSGQPRMGLGYSAMGQLGLLASLRLLRISRDDVETVVRHIERRMKGLDAGVPTQRNQAKQLAKAFVGRLPILVGAEHLVGSMHAFANQLNETAKVYAVPFPLPELNHHLLEGLRLQSVARHAAFSVAASSRYAPRIRERQSITLAVVRRLGLRAISIPVRGPDAMTEAFDLLTIAGFTSFYLSVLNRVDPLSIPTVNELKRRLGRTPR